MRTRIMRHILDSELCDQEPIRNMSEEALLETIRTRDAEDLLDLELAAADVVASMEKRGVGFDPVVAMAQVKEMSSGFSTIMARLEALLRGDPRLEGWDEINLMDPDQVRRLLFDSLGIKPKVWTKTVPSVTQAALKGLQDPGADLVAEARLLGSRCRLLTDLAGHLDLPKMRFFPRYDPIGTRTGRMTCDLLHSLPDDPRIRSAIVAREGLVLVYADLSQLELRVLARLSMDPALISDLGAADVFVGLASSMFGVPAGAVAGEQRKRAKLLVYAMLYGMTPKGMAEEFDWSQDEANEMLGIWSRRYPVSTTWIERIGKEADRAGFACTCMKRRRSLPNGSRASRKRKAVSMVVQGTAAEFCKGKLVALREELPKCAYLVGNIHDGFLIECPENDALPVSEAARRILVQTWSNLDLPLACKVGVGQNWADADENAT